MVDYIERFGYGGLFFVSAISGFNIVVPLPVSSFFPTLMAAGFTPSMTIVVISLGMLAGDSVGYILGRTGRSMVGDSKKEYKIIKIIKKAEKKHPLLPYGVLVLYAAFVPLPNELIVIPMGYLRFRAPLIFISLFVSNILFNIVVASTFVGLSGII